MKAVTASNMSQKADLGDLLESDIPLIAVSFSDAVSDLHLGTLLSEGLDVAEVRVDRFSTAETQSVLSQVRRFSAFPTIATIRTRDEGGDWRGTDGERLALFEAILPEVGGIDIELSSTEILPRLVAAAKARDKVVIVSYHNFQLTPPAGELLSMARRAKDLGADYVKIATMAESGEDVRTLAAFTLENSALGLVVIAMGGHGSMSRVFFPALGSRLTYAHAGEPTGSGQLSYDQTFRMMRTFYPEFNQKKIIV